MDYASIIITLYDAVYKQQKRKYHVTVDNIRKAIGNMKDAYMPDKLWEFNDAEKFTNYNDGAHRCAYLHKHAMIHTGLVCHLLQCAFSSDAINEDINSKRKLNVCSLGGGPGSDVIALLMILKENFDFMPCNVSVIDCDVDWQLVFEAVVAELRTGRYGHVANMVDRTYFRYEYIRADLLNPSIYSKYKIYSAITNADFITMIKFVSAAACNKTRQMVKRIFQLMKPGAMLLFVDNAAGGFHKMVTEVARENGMENVFGPFKHFEYEEERFSRNLYGYTSQYKTKVTVAIWKKSRTNPYNTSEQLRREYVSHRPRRYARAESASVGASEESESCCSII